MTLSGSFTLNSDSWKTVKITSHQIKFYRRNGPHYNVRFENGSETGYYFNPGESWSIVEEHDKSDVTDDVDVNQVDGGLVTPDSLTLESSHKLNIDPPAILPLDKFETRRQIRQRNCEISRKNVNKTLRMYNLRSTTAW